MQALLVPELAEELPFWTDGLGMKVLQSSAGKAVLGYGGEGQGTASGGHFAIELFEDEDDSIKPPVGRHKTPPLILAARHVL
jgi:catechol 2,3-dioxygenase-like lactoylglutathione lyase family enzyme